MKKIIANRSVLLGAALLTPVMALGQGTAAPAQSAAPASPAAAKPAGKTSILGDVWGEVDHIGRDMKSLFVKDKKGGVKEIKLGANASITKGAQKQGISASDLKKGDRVKISSRGDGSQEVHVLVLALPPAERDLKELGNPRRFAAVARLYGQETKVYNDAASGALDERQAEKLIARLDEILAQEILLASKNGGHLDQASYAKLQGELNEIGAVRHDEALGTRMSSR